MAGCHPVIYGEETRWSLQSLLDEPNTVWAHGMIQESERADLLNVHGALVRRVRRIGVFIALLFVFAANLHFERLDLIRRQSTAREAYLSSLPTDSPMLKSVPATPFNSKELPRLYRALQNHLEVTRTGSSHGVFGLQLPFETYVVLLLFGGTAALAAVWATLRQIRTVHATLATQATAGSALQRSLNSVFFDRVTVRYGQGWLGHVALGLLPIVVIALATPLVVVSSGMTSLDPTLYPQAIGGISGLLDTDVIPTVIDSSRLPALALVGLLVVDFALALAVLASAATLTRRPGQPEHRA